MFKMILMGIGKFIINRVITAKNIKKLITWAVGHAEAHATSTENDIDDRAVKEFKKSLGI